MIRKALALLLILVLAATALNAAAAGQVYRWVDDKGVVHYGDRAPESVQATLVGIQPNTVPIARPDAPAAAAAPGAADASAQDETEPLSIAEQRRRERAEKRREYAKESQEREAACGIMRGRRELLEPSPDVLVKGPDGAARRMDDNERLRMLDEAIAFLEKNCDPR